MSAQPSHLDERIVESLCSAYRAAAEDPPYGATDQAMLRVAARHLHGSWVRPTAYIAAALLAAMLGLVMMFAIKTPDKQVQRTDMFGNITRYFLEGDRHAAVSLPRRVVPHDVSQSPQELPVQTGAQPVPTPPACTAGSCGRIATQTASGTPGKISRFLAKDLKAAQDAQKAQNWDLEVQKLQAALAAKGTRTPYDDFIIDSWLGVAYVSLHNYSDAAPAMEAAAESPYASFAQQRAMLQAVVSIYSQLHQYSKAIEAAQIAIKLGVAIPYLYLMMAVDEDQLGQHKEAGQTIQQIIDSEPKPEEKYLVFQWNAYTKANDNADAARVADELCYYYRRPGYCRAH